MHELGVVFHIIKKLEQTAEENQLTKVSSVTMEFGEVSGIVDSYILDCWRWAADKSDLLRGAEMKIEHLPAVTVCNACGATYETVKFGRTCPECGSGDTVLLTGNEVNIKELAGL